MEIGILFGKKTIILQRKPIFKSLCFSINYVRGIIDSKMIFYKSYINNIKIRCHLISFKA